MTSGTPFDPYELLGALTGERVSFVVVGAFARVVHGTGETTSGLDVVPSLRADNLRRLHRALEELDARATRRQASAAQLTDGRPVAARTRAGDLRLVPTPLGTRGYDDLRIRAARENLGRGLRPAIASLADLRRMLEASDRPEDALRLERLTRVMELEHELARRRGPELGV